jgi:hypothetical protein
MDVIHVTPIILIVPDQVLPIAPLPDAALGVAAPVGGNGLGDRSRRRF